MATIVAAAGGGNWSATGSWVGSVVPTASDDVQLASTSGNITITGTAALCRSLDCTGYVGTLAWNNALQIGTSTDGPSHLALKLVSGMTITFAGGSLAFVGSYTTTAQTIDMGGKSLSIATSVSGAGSWQLISAFASTSAITQTNGTFDSNGQSVTAVSFTSSGATARTVTMGASTFTLSALAAWTVSGSNATVNSGTSTITMSNVGATFAGGGLTYYNLTFSGAITGAIINGANTFNNITATSAAAKINTFTFGASQTVNGTLNLNGTSAINRLLVQSSAIGTTVTLTCAAVSMTYVDLQDIAGAGASSWDLHAITGLSGDCGGNSGITFTAATTQTATGTASFSWSTHGWTTHVPLPQDTVSIPNAFIATRTVTCDMPRLGKDITFSCTGNPTISTNTVTSIYGNLTLATGMLSTQTAAVSFSGRGSQTITTAGVSLTCAPIINAPSGTYQLQDTFTTTGILSTTQGTLDLNGKTLTALTWTNTGTLTRAINYNGGTLALSQTTAVTVATCSGSGYTTIGTGTISISTASANTRTFAGGGFTYPILQYTVASSTGQLSVTGSNTFAGISFSDSGGNRTLAFTAGTTTTISLASGWQIFGSAVADMNVTGVTAATWTLSIASGVVSSDWVDYVNSHALGGASFYAGANSFDGGGNTGWAFSAAPVPATTLDLMGVGA